MKSLNYGAVGLLVCLAQVGCAYRTDRLLFAEETHLGLVARVSPDRTAPADIDFGYRRSVVTLTPQINAKMEGPKDGYPDDYPFGEIMSVISSFTAKVGW